MKVNKKFRYSSEHIENKLKVVQHHDHEQFVDIAYYGPLIVIKPKSKNIVHIQQEALKGFTTGPLLIQIDFHF